MEGRIPARFPSGAAPELYQGLGGATGVEAHGELTVSVWVDSGSPIGVSAGLVSTSAR